MLGEKSNYRKCCEARDESGPLFPDVAAIEDRADNRSIGGGTPHPKLLEAPYQRRLGVSGRRLGLMLSRQKRSALERLPLLQRRQVLLSLLELGRRVVATFDVGTKESRKQDGIAANREPDRR